jgi:hypothetical protein
MPTAIIRYDLSDPDDEREHRYALAGRDALLALEAIREDIRYRLKYVALSDETVRVLEEIREHLPHELIDLLI